MAIESTLLIVKPDGVRRGLVGEVLRRVEAKGSDDRGDAPVHDPAPDRRGALRRAPRESRSSASWSTSSRAVRSSSRRSRGEDAITCWRTLMGPTNPVQAPPGSIRGDFATLIGENIVHGSDSPRVGRSRARAVLRLSAHGRAGRGVRADRRAAEHQLEASHAAGLALGVTDGEEVLGVVVPGPRRRRARTARSAGDTLPDRVDLEVIRLVDRAPGGGRRAASTCTSR